MTTGRVADTNGQWAAGELTKLGLTVVLKLGVDDVPSAIGDALALAMARADLVWMTGGLGPTRDDLTVAAVSSALGLRTAEDAATLRRIEDAYGRRGAVVTPEARRMAAVPEGGEALANPAGTAPGIWLETGGRVIVMFPGVPAEMKAIASQSVLPRLAAMAVPPRLAVYRVMGLPEGEVDRRVADLWASVPPGVAMALQIDAGEVMLRVSAHASWEDFDALDRAIRDRLGDALWTTGDGTMEAHIVRRLAEAGLTVALAESLTGGMVAGRLTSVPGASAVLKGGWVTYTDAAKADWLGVDPAVIRDRGAVSGDAAAAMARGALKASGSDIAVSTTGWAGPEGGTVADPVGTVYIGAAWRGGDAVERRWFRGDRRQVREYAVTFALDRIRRCLPPETGSGTA